MKHSNKCKSCQSAMVCDCGQESPYLMWNKSVECYTTVYCFDCREKDVQEKFNFEDAETYVGSDGVTYKIIYKGALALPVPINPPALVPESGSYISYSFKYAVAPSPYVKFKNIEAPEPPESKPESKPKPDATPVYIPGTVNTKPENSDPFHTSRKNVMKVNMHSKLGKALLRRAK